MRKQRVEIDQSIVKRGGEEDEQKMIYRKWSLLTGPTAILAGVVAAVVVANFVFVENVIDQSFL